MRVGISVLVDDQTICVCPFPFRNFCATRKKNCSKFMPGAFLSSANAAFLFTCFFWGNFGCSCCFFQAWNLKTENKSATLTNSHSYQIQSREFASHQQVSIQEFLAKNVAMLKSTYFISNIQFAINLDLQDNTNVRNRCICVIHCGEYIFLYPK